MNIFEHPNLGSGWKCPVCNTNEDKPVTLIGIAGTQEKYKMQAEQVHVDCIELTWDRQFRIIYQHV